MKLYSAKVPQIAREIIDQLTKDGDIEVTNHNEAELDIQSVLKGYLRTEREINDNAKDLIQKRGLPQEQFNRIRRLVAEERAFALGDEGPTWMCNQILETFMQSQYIEEVFANDAVLRRKMGEIIRHHMMVDEDLDAEVRQRIKNLEEGSSSWDIEYAKAMDQIKRKRGLTA